MGEYGSLPRQPAHTPHGSAHRRHRPQFGLRFQGEGRARSVPQHRLEACRADRLQKIIIYPTITQIRQRKISEWQDKDFAPAGAIRPSRGHSAGANRPSAPSRLERIAPLRGLRAGSEFRRKHGSQRGWRGQAVAVLDPELFAQRTSQGRLEAAGRSCRLFRPWRRTGQSAHRDGPRRDCSVSCTTATSSGPLWFRDIRSCFSPPWLPPPPPPRPP